MCRILCINGCCPSLQLKPETAPKLAALVKMRASDVEQMMAVCNYHLTSCLCCIL